MPATPLPPEDVRSALARAAVDNADRLLGDALTLAAAGSAPTAHSLAVLAFEEVGKAVICSGGFAGSDNTVTTREKFIKDIGSHAAKSTWARNFVDVIVAMMRRGLSDNFGMGASPEEYLQTLQERRKRDNDQKMQGFYVDLSASDEVELPERITAEEAESMISLARWTSGAVRALFIEGKSFELFRFAEPGTERLTAEGET